MTAKKKLINDIDNLVYILVDNTTTNTTTDIDIVFYDLNEVKSYLIFLANENKISEEDLNNYIYENYRIFEVKGKKVTKLEINFERKLSLEIVEEDFEMFVGGFVLTE